ncbi:MAG: type II toxin-antitoxin system RelE/ParE family toxin [Ignavibacteria bacterium]|nr:type II toxin-antitoxin system RelE/ParE family toxin [Ignavibacteria bacterium]
MERTFIELPLFSKIWKEAGLNDDDLRLLQRHLLENPKAGSVMQGISGLRKIRWNVHGHGKSGGVRICYLDLPDAFILILIHVFKKNEKDNLTSDEKIEFKNIVNEIKNNYKTND